MKVIGIVGEYNPFHFGHAYHIEQSRKKAGEDSAVVCVMSGDFVQRGSAAVYSKFARAEAAVKSGVDLVLELPTPWALSSAEGFARGAVGILDGIGVVDTLSFGSECGDAAALKKAANILLCENTAACIRRVLDENEGISFAAARQKAVESLDADSARLLSMPNNILGIEYLKAIIASDSKLDCITVQRTGASHDSKEELFPRSASDIRTRLQDGTDISGDIPESADEVYKREQMLGRGPLFSQDLELAAISRLRSFGLSDFEKLQDCGEGLARCIATAAKNETSLEAIAAAAKSKRYALSRIRRILMCAVLGIEDAAAKGVPPYARVLVANEIGCGVLKAAKDKSCIPILTKPATVRELGDEAVKLFELCSDAHDFYVLGYSALPERRGGDDWRHSPIIL